LSVYYGAGRERYTLWNNGAAISPMDLKKEYGHPLDGKLYFTYSTRKEKNLEISIFEENQKNSKTKNMFFHGELDYLGTFNDILYFRKRYQANSNEDYYDEILGYSINEMKMVNSLLLPQIYFAPTRNTCIVSEGKLYYLLSAKDGLYLFEIKTQGENTRDNPFNKFDYKGNPFRIRREG